MGCRESKVDRPVKALKDFARVELEPGKETKVSLSVSKRDMAYFDEEKDEFVTEDIKYVAYIGNCSAEAALQKIEFTF